MNWEPKLSLKITTGISQGTVPCVANQSHSQGRCMAPTALPELESCYIKFAPHPVTDGSPAVRASDKVGLGWPVGRSARPGTGCWGLGQARSQFRSLSN